MLIIEYTHVSRKCRSKLVDSSSFIIAKTFAIIHWIGRKVKFWTQFSNVLIKQFSFFRAKSADPMKPSILMPKNIGKTRSPKYESPTKFDLNRRLVILIRPISNVKSIMLASISEAKLFVPATCSCDFIRKMYDRSPLRKGKIFPQNVCSANIGKSLRVDWLMASNWRNRIVFDKIKMQ